MLKFAVIFVISLLFSYMCGAFFPALHTQVFHVGRWGFTWLFLIAGLCMFAFYRGLGK